uniref:IclR helix-turn-helix domain-containing protein n=1 Tax=Candidatus Kentrum sp. LPFa TaxID=2126335 RepID=A0A450WD89_9GAMM|nr:MAG: hypothetical protein BECKLPF1236B_GA0070989_107113 [Candidatus Kentron sp. LPFa]
MADYTNACQQRILRTLLALFGHEIDGLAPGQVAKRLGTTPANATRDLFNLEKSGLAERIPRNGHYRVTPLLGQKALSTLSAIDAAGRRVEETRQRYTRTA